jgi:hypothetical protein
MDADRFNKIAGGVQSIITALGIAVGGIWVLFTFQYLGTAEKSRAELAELDLKQHETQEALAERQPILAIDLTWETAGMAADGKRFVSLQAKLHDNGKRPVQFQDTGVLISRLLPQSGEPDSSAKPLRLAAKLLDDDGALSDPPARILRSGQTRIIAFLMPTLAPGNYLVQLKALYTGMVLKDGRFEDSTDEPILAIEQQVVNVPAELPNPE